LFDPWIFGPSYYGSWHLDPKPVIDQTDLKPSAIIITHPHPDHFHLETLKRIDPNTPIYFPNFPSNFIENGLSEINWKNTYPVSWDEKIDISKNLSIKFIRHRSMWEDSAVLTTVNDGGVIFQWINLVDAGSVIDEFSLPDLDLISSAFNQGASGYPLTWSHLKSNSKIKILEEQKKQTLSLLPSRSKRLNAKYFLPFAGHWRLGLPQHQIYDVDIPRTDFSEIIAETNTGVFFDYFQKDALKTAILSFYKSFLEGKLGVNAVGLEAYSRIKLTEKLSEVIYNVNDHNPKN
jgi:CMP-N-acetylneuraminate monooxygenase